jgi:hypothetical protein
LSVSSMALTVFALGVSQSREAHGKQPYAPWRNLLSADFRGCKTRLEKTYDASLSLLIT